MQNIINRIKVKGGPSELISPLQIVDRSEVEKNPRISEAFHSLAAEVRLGSQYEWLACYASQCGERLELGIVKDGPIGSLLSDHVVAESNECGNVYRLNDKAPDYLQLFSHFRFPLLDFTKLDMYESAKQNGYLDLMELTWFCHKPLFNGKPCGACVPCSITKKEGFAYRVPPTPSSRRLSNFARRIIPVGIKKAFRP